MFFGDLRANAYAVNAITGALLWKTKVEDHPAAVITGAPTLYAGVLYVPVSSWEESIGTPAAYQCCTFRGSVVALDMATGKQIWKGYTIPEAPRPTKRNAVGTQLHGPSGAAVWSAPTVDVQRQVLYVDDRRQLFRPSLGNQRCDSCVRSGDRPDALASAAYRERQLHHLVPRW